MLSHCKKSRRVCVAPKVIDLLLKSAVARLPAFEIAYEIGTRAGHAPSLMPH